MITYLHKHKGNHQACNNHQGISLLSTAGKILARIILDCHTANLDNSLLPESQCGFQKEHGTINMMFAARQLQEKSQEKHCDLCSFT